MKLTDKITADLTAGMKSGKTDQVAVLRLIKNGLKNEQIRLGHELSDEEALKVLSREAKQRRDSIEAYTAGQRPELAAAEKVELDLIEAYLPQLLSTEETVKLVETAIAETGATDLAQMGQVIGRVMSLAGGRADGGEVSRLVRERLS